MMKFERLPEIEAELQKVNLHIERLCQSRSPSMQRMMDWVLANRGKQIRPVLTLLCAKLKGRRVDVTELAAVIEICHTASLIHDDIIDNADLRRDQLSVQKKFGQEMAVYAGDFMIFAAIGRTNLVNKPWYRTMFANLETMCDGEVGQFDNQYNLSISEETYISNILGKTSAMFVIACGAGAYEGACNKAERARVERFAERFGLLFQLRDDLMDFAASSAASQKSVHSDFWCGYYTLPAIRTFQHPVCGVELTKLAADLKNGVRQEYMDKRIAELIYLSGGFQYTLNSIEQYGAEAKDCLTPFPPSAAKDYLIGLVDTLLKSARDAAEAFSLSFKPAGIDCAVF